MSGIGYKRLVIGMAHDAASQRAVEAVADFAQFLDIEILAAFIADTTLSALTELSGARELRALELVWQTLEPAKIIGDTDLAVDVVRRRFAQGVGGRPITASFDVVAGAEAITSLIGADDIVAIIEPSHPLDRITWQFTALLDAAFAKAGAALVVPREPVRTSGPIVTVDDSAGVAVRAAVEIAAALKERLIIMTEFGAQPSRDILARARQLSVEVEQIVSTALSMGAVQAVTVGSFGERMRVLSSRMLAVDGGRLSLLLHGIPLLVIGSREAGSTPGRRQREVVKPSA